MSTDLYEAFVAVFISDIGKILFIAFLLLLFFFFEYFFPAETDHTFKAKMKNVGIILIFFFIGGIFYAFTAAIIPLEYHTFSYDSVFLSLFAIFLHLFIGDFVYYWYHRAQHKYAPLWSIHELHHSDSALNASSSLRTFFLERPVQYLLVVVPTYYLISLSPLGSVASLDALSLVLLPMVFTTWLFFTHANIRLDLGPVTKIFTGPQLHRVHHSTKPEHIDTNFAQFFPIFDLLFGTYVHPKKDEFPKTGTKSLHSNVTLREILFKPFGD